MKPCRVLALSTLLGMLGGCAASGGGFAAASALPPEARQAPDRYVVVTVPNALASTAVRAGGTPRGYNRIATYSVSDSARRAARQIGVDYGLAETASWPIGVLGVHCIVYALPPAMDRPQLLARLGADRRVESVQPLVTFVTQASAYNDPYARLQPSLGLMAVQQAQQWSRGDGVRVAVIDTGVDTGHPDLSGRIAGERNFVDGDAQAFRADLHGTAVAGVIAAVANNHIGIAGIAPGVRLYAYKACWHGGAEGVPAVCNTFTLAQALAASIDAGVALVNLSLAGPADPLLARIVERGLGRGIVFIGAAPPGGARDGFPGNVPGVITADVPGRRTGSAADLTAPANDVLTLVPGMHYDFASGSSLAAAQASGVVALMLAVQRKLRGPRALELLARTSQPVTTPYGSFSAINACAALVALQGRGTCPSSNTSSLALGHERATGP
jgi:subtilisin family serine protease